MNHTKGEWAVLPDGLTIKAKIEHKPHYDAEPPQTFIAKCFQNGHLGRTKRPTEEDLANARLIAAAPVQNQVLRNVYADAELLPDGRYAITEKRLQDINSAITKAKEGE